MGYVEAKREDQERGAPGRAAPELKKSGRVECFKKHCLRCRKYSNHRHTPAEYNTPCILCKCPYFFGWDSYCKARGITKEQLNERRKRPEKTTQRVATPPMV